ncbi:MAG: hypothetical protein ACTHN5_14815 [Phycisphaerae bacterium]
MGVLEYRRAEGWRVPWGKVVVGMIALVVVGWVVTRDYAVDGFYVCQECGEQVRVRYWYGFERWTSRVETPTSVSEALAAHGVGVGHVHRLKWYHGHWISLVGGGRWECAASSEMSALLSNARYGGGFLDNLYTYGDVQTAELWRRRMLDFATARRVEEAQSKLDPALPDGWFTKFETKKDFDLWGGKAGVVMEREFVAGGK